MTDYDVALEGVNKGGKLVNDIPPGDRGTPLMFQGLALFPHMTAWKNVEFGLKTRKVEPAQRRHLVVEALESVGMGGLAAREPSDFSGGRRQRLLVDSGKFKAHRVTHLVARGYSGKINPDQGHEWLTTTAGR